MSKPQSPFLTAIAVDRSLPIEKAAVDCWLKDSENPLRWIIQPLLQLFFAILLHIVWWLKRLPLPQFSAHGLLQKLICWFCNHLVSPEANLLILRHFATESNILNFLADNSPSSSHAPKNVHLYPLTINDMLRDSFVEHDQELFRMMTELGHWESLASSKKSLSWEHWQPIDMEAFSIKKRRTQVIDFASAHALFMCLFCLLLTRQEYSDAINGFNLDQSIAIRIGQIIGDQQLPEMAYNKNPLYIVGPSNLSQRFLMHGFFTEHLYARLEGVRQTLNRSQTTPSSTSITATPPSSE